MKTSALTASAARRRSLFLAFALLATATLLLLAARPARADLVVSADLGPVRVLYADDDLLPGASVVVGTGPVLIGSAPRCVRPVVRYLPPRGPVARHVCRLSYAHDHRYVLVPGHWEKVRGHGKRWVAGQYVCRGEGPDHRHPGRGHGHGRGHDRDD